jgi:hypothetical protein
MKKVLPFLLLLFFYTGCLNEKKSSTGLYKVISIDPRKTVDKNVDDIIKNPVFIQLETHDDCLLKFIHKVQIVKDRIYIFNSDNGGVVYCFNMQGKYLFTIGKRGMGPGEYIYLMDIYVDESEGFIWLGDDGKRILKFDLDGKFVEQYATEFSTRNLIPIEKEDLAVNLGYYADKNYSFITYSLKDKKIFYYREITNLANQIISGSRFSKYRNEIIYALGFNDTIFNVKKSGLTPKYIVDFGNHKVPELLSGADKRKFFMDFLNPKNNYAGLIGLPCETDDYLFFTYDFSGQGMKACYFKKDEKLISIKDIVFYGNKKFNAAKYFLRTKTEKGYVSFLHSHLLTENTDTTADRQPYGRYIEFDDLLLNLRADDNPVLILSDVGL